MSRYTKTDLVFSFLKNQSLVAVILGLNCFWIIAENHFEMSINGINVISDIQHYLDLKSFKDRGEEEARLKWPFIKVKFTFSVL